MKSVSAIIVIILILMIVVALAAIAYTFFSGMFTSLTETGSSSITQITETLSSCMKIEGSYQNKLYLRNCGQGILSNNSLNIYIDDVSFSFNMTPSSISYGELATISLPIWGLSIGNHQLKITNPKIELVKIIESVLHGSAVLAFDFDEGSEIIVYDKSRFNNHGTLKNQTGPCGDTACPTWVNGKFGSGLEFDGIGDFVDVSNNPSFDITDAVTLEAWIKPYYADHTGFCRITWFYNNIIDFAFTNYVIGIWLTFNDDTDTNWLVGDTTLIYGQWYYVAATFSKESGKVYIYVNDTKDEEFDVAKKSIKSLSNNAAVGNINDFNRGFNGTIDSVRVYNKALKPEETVILKIK